MAIKHKGSGVFTYNLDIQAPKPFDSRLVVESYSADLAGENYKSTFVLGGANAWYDGMIVYAEDTKKVYVLKGDEGFVEVGQDLSDAELTDTTYSFESAKKDGVAVGSGAYFTVTEEGKSPVKIYVDADVAGTAAAAVATEAERAAQAEEALTEAIENEASRASGAEEALGKRIDDLAAASVSVAEKADGHVRVSKATDETTGAVVYTISENDIASAQGLADEIERAGEEEARIEGLVTAEAARAAGEEARIEGLVTAEKGRAEGAEADLRAAITTLNGADTVSGSVAKAVKDAKDSLLGSAQTLTDFAKVETAIANAEAVAKAAASVVEEGTDAGNNLSIVPTTGENGAITYTVNLSDVASAATLADVKADVDYFFSDALNKENADALKDTLKEIQTYIDSDVVGAAAMAQSIKTNSDAIDAIEADYLTSADKTELTGAIATAKGEAVNTASQNTTAAITTLNATVGSQTVAEGKHVAVEVVETAGKLTGLTIVESDIASAKEVEENAQVTAAAINDLNERLKETESNIAAGVGVMSIEGEDPYNFNSLPEEDKALVQSHDDFVYVTANADDAGKVALDAQVVITKSTINAKALATDAYVQEIFSWASF